MIDEQDIAINVESINLHFPVLLSPKSQIVNLLRGKISSIIKRKKFHAIKDISFNVRRGGVPRGRSPFFVHPSAVAFAGGGSGVFARRLSAAPSFRATAPASARAVQRRVSAPSATVERARRGRDAPPSGARR